MGNSLPLLGERFPEMEVHTIHGKIKLPDNYKGKWVVLFSHPADFTPVCTTEFIAFQKKYDEFKKLNCELIGLSIDQPFSHIKWIEWINEKFKIKIKFPVISDSRGEVSEKLGMIAPKKGTNTVRAVFVIDDKGIIRSIIYYPQEVGRNVNEILRLVKALQISDKHGVAMPHNWPENEIIGNSVIIPPASDESTASERLKAAEKGEIKCFDWWFCYKEFEKL